MALQRRSRQEPMFLLVIGSAPFQRSTSSHAAEITTAASGHCSPLCAHRGGMMGRFVAPAGECPECVKVFAFLWWMRSLSGWTPLVVT